jgi:oxaloacetate decarboxylase alpha subunit
MARLGLPVPIDLAVLEPVTRHFDEIAEAEGLPKGVPLQFDVAQYVHAVPGGVISHLHHQLRQIGLFDRLEAVLDEIGRVRADLGHPIMVTPFSQFVCSQATLNVISGERYRQISDEIIALALGHWGREAAEDISPDLRDRILSTPRARTLLAEGREETPLAVIRDRLGGSAVSDPELILRYIAPLAEIAAMRAAGPHRSYETGGNALLHLVRSLVARERFDRISIEAGGNRLALARGTGPGGAP